ncbi:MAG: hypothetical protein LBT26_09450 [Clostridiales Family XIII bacterium]|jgi:hypothetical protein|nr:hypothetical protein [Clostridiales Family XIII bacterium]
MRAKPVRQSVVCGCLLLFFLFVSAGCAGGTEQSALDKKITDGIADPNPLISQAWILIRSDLQTAAGGTEDVSAQVPGARFTDVQLLEVERTDRFDDFYADSAVEAYTFTYRVKPENLSETAEAAGASVDEAGWLVRTGGGHPRRILVENKAGEIRFICVIQPEGENGGTRGAALAALMDADLREGRNVARLALLQLEASLRYTESEVQFQIPAAYPKPADWSIRVAARLPMGSLGADSVLFAEESENRSWAPGGIYTIKTEGYLGLRLHAALPDGEGGEIETNVDLLK